ncbi:MAG: SCP2 sterol-binding domain-containing protein [Acidimicrobiia bacterium]|nr:SCP2 sterol-binding domain-containing protein [Acidimicrobiia bacterium]
MAAVGETNRTSAARAFFEELAHRGHEPLLRRLSGTIRFDLTGGRRTEHWYVTVRKGDVAVSRQDAEADAILRTDRALFDDLATGRANAMAATLRGAMQPEGDVGLIVSFQRLFPGPARGAREGTRPVTAR